MGSCGRCQHRLGDTPNVMSVESTTPDLVELVRGFWASAARRDWDAILRFYAPDAVWDMSPMGLGTYEDATAIRGLWTDWVGGYQELELDVEALDVGKGSYLHWSVRTPVRLAALVAFKRNKHLSTSG